ncbi:MAG TPA: SGNH/GDSL hydrolase family protein [Bacteroidia bacterium]|jgi:hypothetical protein|nr:SGNH/GDSL hydrolase family protein [Bacteroidia bacterium]
MKKYFLPLVFLTTVTVSVCYISCTPQLDPPSPQAGSCNFSSMVAVGGDFMSGYGNGSLTFEGQQKSIPGLLTRQLRLFSPCYFQQYPIPATSPGLGWNLKPWENWFSAPSSLGYHTDCLGVNSLMPLQDSVSKTDAFQIINNVNTGVLPEDLSVPFAKITDLFDPALGNYSTSQNTNPYYHRMATNPGVSTAIRDAYVKNATFFTAWLGMEDIYDYAQLGGAGVSITSSATFSMYLDSALSRLTANGAKGVIANIPDFRDFPFYTLVPWNGANLTQSKADSLNAIYQISLPNIVFHEGNNGFVIADPNAPNGYRQMHEGEYILLDVPLDSMKCNFLGLLFGSMPDRYVLDSAEVANIDAAIASYNSIIAQKAAQYGLALVDMNSYFEHVNAGIKWDGVDFNTEFVTGGFYSLDGYHPNEKGYALITNEFIAAINAKYGSTIPTLNCFDCNGIIFP